MMMARMAKKLDIGGYGCVRPACPDPRGGGRRRVKPLLQYRKKDWMKELGAQVRNHLMPRGLVGLFVIKFICVNKKIYIYTKIKM